MNAENAIEIRGLEKTYAGTKDSEPKQALKGIDLTVRRGAMLGLLGPNGAGKSTCINILAGLVRKTGGTARVWGFDIDENPRNAKAAIGVVPQELYFDAFFTPREMLELQAGLYGVPKSERRTDEILAAVRLSDKADAYARTLSGGMKRRLLVAKAMVHSPPILVLDEPTAGVDIELRQQLWDYVRELNRAGVTIVLTTHYLEEAEKLCDDIAIINNGEVVACEPTAKLLSRIDEKVVVLRLDGDPVGRPLGLDGFRLDYRGGSDVAVHYTPSSGVIGGIMDSVRAAGFSILDVTTEQGDLEDIFLQLTRAA
ncbi:ABC transporter ATP-binding protein [Govanella unica]